MIEERGFKRQRDRVDAVEFLPGAAASRLICVVCADVQDLAGRRIGQSILFVQPSISGHVAFP